MTPWLETMRSTWTLDTTEAKCHGPLTYTPSLLPFRIFGTLVFPFTSGLIQLNRPFDLELKLKNGT